jgi:hypothetical protein
MLGQKRLCFHAVTSSRIFFMGCFVFLFSTAFFLLIFLILEMILGKFGANSLKFGLSFSLVTAISVVLLLSRQIGKIFRQLLQIEIDEKGFVLSLHGRIIRNIFFDEIEKIQISGWFKEDYIGIYRLLRITSSNSKITLLVGNTNLFYFSSRDELLAFDLFFDEIEKFVIKKKFKKVNRIKAYNFNYQRNYYYVKSM